MKIKKEMKIRINQIDEKIKENLEEEEAGKIEYE